MYRRCDGPRYQDETGQEECKPCPQGSYCPKKGTTSPSDCGASNFCGEGASKPTPCRLCSPGSGEADPGTCALATGGAKDRTCAECAAGKFSKTSSASPCEDCGEGNYCPAGAAAPLPCQLCPPGSGEADPGTCPLPAGGARDRTCAACEPGRFSSAEDTSPCEVCPGGKFSTERAAKASTACQPCERQDYEGPEDPPILYADAKNSTFCPGGSVRLVKSGYWRAAVPGNHTTSAGMLTYKVGLSSRCAFMS